MRINSTLPKTFSIYVEKGKKCGYVRLVSTQDGDGSFYYILSIVKHQRDASKYVNLDNVKKIALKYQEKYNFTEVRILDDKLNKFYYVKEKTAKAKYAKDKSESGEKVRTVRKNTGRRGIRRGR